MSAAQPKPQIVDPRAVALRLEQMRDSARHYLSLNWPILWIPPDSKTGGPSKNPNRKKWHLNNLLTVENVSLLEANWNIGLRLDAHVDIDTDMPVLAGIVERRLPATGFVWGRASAPASHRLYAIADIKHKKFSAPPAPGQKEDDERLSIIEIRHGGPPGRSKQSILPPSMHPSGEPYEFEDGCDYTIGDWTAEECLIAVSEVAALGLLKLYWKEGIRYDVSMALAGAMARNGWAWERAEKFLSDLTLLTGSDKLIYRATETYDKVGKGQEVTGIPSLKKLLGEAATASLVEWMSLDGQADEIWAESGERSPYPLSTQLGKADIRPGIQVKAGELPLATDEAEKVLVDHAKELGIFQHNAHIVKVITLDEPEEDARLKRPVGTVLLKPLKLLGLMETFTRLIGFTRRDKKDEKKLVPIGCPSQLAGSYLERLGEWKLPHLRGTITAPVIRSNGTILTAQGYDEETGLYLVSSCEWLPVPEEPSHHDAKRALAELLTPFSEFPFVTEADKAVVVAAILTALQRRLLGPCPMFTFSAPTPRTGKSLLAEAVAIIAMGKPAPASAVSWDNEELRKSFTAALREGHLIINLDNVIGDLSSAELCKILTQERYSDRLLGETERLSLRTNCLWTATGNNLTLRGELTVRALMCHIDAEMENPEIRNFQVQDFSSQLAEQRAELVRAALTILRAFHVAKKPQQEVEPWGGFNDWSRSIREPLVWAGLTDPCETRESVIASDPEKENGIGLLQELSKVFRNEQFYARDVMHKVNEEIVTKNVTGDITDREYKHPDLRSAVEVIAAKDKEIIAKKFGSWLRNWQGRPAGGFRLYQVGGTKPKKWAVELADKKGKFPERKGNT